VAEEKRQFIDDQRRRNAVEGKFGQGKRRFGFSLIREKLALTQGSTIAMNILVMNLERLLVLLFVLFICWLQHLWARGLVNNSHSDRFLAHGVMAWCSNSDYAVTGQCCCPAVVAAFSGGPVWTRITRHGGVPGPSKGQPARRF
jgi:hypothetical protein